MNAYRIPTSQVTTRHQIRILNVWRNVVSAHTDERGDTTITSTIPGSCQYVTSRPLHGAPDAMVRDR